MKIKTTAVQWLKDRYKIQNGYLHDEDFTDAAEIERMQITKSYWQGVKLIGIETKKLSAETPSCNTYELVLKHFKGQTVVLEDIYKTGFFNKYSKKHLGSILSRNNVKRIRKGEKKICHYVIE